VLVIGGNWGEAKSDYWHTLLLFNLRHSFLL